MKLPFAFQRAQPHHAQALTDITVTAKRHWKYPEHWIQTWIPMLTISPQYIQANETWMAVVNERPVAYYSLKHDDPYLWLDNLWVLPDFMGKGIGAKLFKHALNVSRACQVSILMIESDPNAQTFYEKMGARKIDEHHSQLDGQLRTLPIMAINL